MNALDTFLATAKRIEDILRDHGALASARAKPAVAARRIDEVSIRAEQPYYNRSPEPETIAAAKAIREHLKADLIAAAEMERDAKLHALAAELAALAGDLGNQATAARIELGHQARMLEHEANGGTV